VCDHLIFKKSWNSNIKYRMTRVAIWYHYWPI